MKTVQALALFCLIGWITMKAVAAPTTQALNFETYLLLGMVVFGLIALVGAVVQKYRPTR